MNDEDRIGNSKFSVRYISFKPLMDTEWLDDQILNSYLALIKASIINSQQ